MSGNTSNINIMREELHDLVINEQERDEFGFQMFQSPYTQVPFERAQREYKLKYNLKKAYDNQEFLRKMRADIKREYLTRKKQLKKLQQDAAVMFREDEMKLQEHYSTEFAKSQPRRDIDIHAPLVSHVALPHDECMNIKEFNIEQAFEGLRRLHREYYESDMEAAIRQVREYEYERQAREDEEARVAQAARLRAEHEAEAEAEAAEAERKRRWHELSLEEEQQLWFENTRGVNDPWSEDDDDDDDDHNDNGEEHPCDEVIVPAASVSASTSAQSSRGHSHNNPATKKKKAAKARVAKQQQKQQTKQQANKFIPFQVTDNTNHTNEVTAILTANKLEINLPKKNLQNASREAIKRHNKKWNRVNALAKQSGARGTKIANLPDPRPWYNNSTCYDYGYESD
jgi:hypothetical protein